MGQARLRTTLSASRPVRYDCTCHAASVDCVLNCLWLMWTDGKTDAYLVSFGKRFLLPEDAERYVEAARKTEKFAK